MIKNKIKRILSLIRPTVNLSAKITYLSPNNRLQGKKIIITGGGRGLGAAMAEKFISEGAEVLITGRNEKSLKEVSDRLHCKYIVFDVSNFGEIQKFLKEADQALQGANVLVNNAGISLHEGNIFNVSLSQYDQQFNTNLKASYFLAQQFIEMYKKDKRTNGSVLFVSSERGSYVDDIPYCLTKAAINSLTQSLAKLLIKDSIRINAVAPGVTASDMTGRVVGGSMYAPQYATGRTYQPEEVAEVACFLLSDASSCLSGQILVCNNGDSANTYK